MFGSPGNADGQFNGPSGVSVDPRTSHIVVADQDNHRVQVFDSEGRFVRKFGSQGTAAGRFSGPVGVSVDPRSSHIVW